jgi:hypothetical protein
VFTTKVSVPVDIAMLPVEAEPQLAGEVFETQLLAVLVAVDGAMVPKTEDMQAALQEA